MEQLTSPRDRELIESFLAGNRAAFEELVRPYLDRVYNALFRMVGNPDDAADLLQETLLRAFRNLAGFHGESAFYTWLFRIAMNLALSRKRSRRRTMTMDPIESMDQLADGKDQPPESNLVRDEQKNLVQRALEVVDADHRAILVLKDIEGLKYEQISEILNIPLGTVRSRLHRARLELEKILRPWFDKGLQ